MVSLYHTYFTSFFQDCKAVKCGVLSSQCVKECSVGANIVRLQSFSVYAVSRKSRCIIRLVGTQVRTYGLHRIFWHAKL